MKVLFLGIDALDRMLLDRFSDNLPNFNLLRQEGVSLHVKSTFPPDSDTAWATISTGLNPAQHGIVRFVDPLQKSYEILNVGINNRPIRGRTFWDLIGREGYKVAAIFPHLGYPLWPTPGLMVARSSTESVVQATEPRILSSYPDAEMITGVRGFPRGGEKGLARRAEQLVRLTLADAEFALHLLKSQEWDLFFVYWSTLDAVGHFFWSYFDHNDPHFVQGHPLADIIPRTYQIYDEVVGRFLAAIDEEMTVIVLSDHGHGMRPFRLINVNEILRQAGFLHTRNNVTNPYLSAFEASKRFAIRTVSELQLGRLAGQVLRHFPGAIQSFTRPATVNWDKTMAYASDMSGIKSYSYGGIILNREKLDGNDYEAVRSEIIKLLLDRCILDDGTKLIKSIKRREDLYHGPFIKKYPDIILELEYGFGVGWAVKVPLFSEAAGHNLVPGSHRSDTGTCLIRSPREITADFLDLHNVLPSLLDLMQLLHSEECNGRSIFRPLKAI